MNGILASVVSSLVVATGAAGVAIQNDPSLLSFSYDPPEPLPPLPDEVDNLTESLPPLPSLPGQDDNSTGGNSTEDPPQNETDDGPDDGSATGGCACNATEEEPEDDGAEAEGGCGTYDESNETTPACGYYVNDYATTLGPESATWQWEVTDSISRVYVSVYAGGEGQGLLGEESSVRLLDPKGRVVAQATDGGGILDDGMWMEVDLDRSALKAGTYKLELDSEYALGQYSVYIVAACDY